MGTRNLVSVKLDGKIRCAQYGQWDGGLNGQGETVIDFIQNKMSVVKFKKALRDCRFITPDENEATWIKAGATKGQSMVSMDIADKHGMMYPGLCRDTGAQILELIQDGIYHKTVEVGNSYKKQQFTVQPIRELVDSSTFQSDGLFCEWAYLLDLDTKTLTIFTGGQNVFATLTFAQAKKKNALADLKKLDKDEE